MSDIRSVVEKAMVESDFAEFDLPGIDAPKPVETKPEEPATPKMSIAEYIRERIDNAPNEIIAPSEEHSEMATIPGFENLTLGLANAYGIKWGALGVALSWKEKAYQPHLVQTGVGVHFVRGFSRREWSLLQKKIHEHTRDRISKHQEENTDPRWAETEISMHTEEMIVVAGSLEPKYTMESIRSIPSGIVSYLANCVMIATGHDANALPPLALK